MDAQLENGGPTQDFVSLLADGRLLGAEFANAVDAVSGDAEARATWHAYHVMGEVLRHELPPAGSDAAFLARFRDRLAAEPVVARPPVDVVGALPGVQSALPRGAVAANESVFRWKLVAGFASMVAVSALAWSTIGGLGVPGGAAPQLAQAPQPELTKVQTAAIGASPVMIRDARLDALMAAHKQTAGGSALHMSSGFLRNATFEGAAR